MFGWREGEIGTQLADCCREAGGGRRGAGDRRRPGSRRRRRPSRCSGGSPTPAPRSSSTTSCRGTRTASSRDRRFDWRQDEVGRADHRKLYVIDGKVAWTGGAGIQDHFRNGGFHDVMVRVTGAVVRQAQALFLTSFRGHGGPLPADLDPYFPPPPERGTIPIALLQVVPGGFRRRRRRCGTVDHARTRLDVMNPYLTDGLDPAHEAAAKRGVEVRIVVSREVEQPAGVRSAEAPLRRPLARRRAHLRVPRRRRARQADGRRRHDRLRHRQPRRVGALPRTSRLR